MQKNNAFCSICTVNYSAYAATLNDSLRKAGHNEPHYVLIVDYDEKYKEIIEKFKFKPIFLHELKIPRINELIKKYSAFELCNALRPFFFEWLLKNHKEIESLIYLDTDIYVYNPLSEIIDFLNKNKNISVAITPHIKKYEAYSKISDYSIEVLYMRAGLYNSGFYVFKNDQNSLQFLGWFKKKMFDYCYNAQNAYMFVDQKILDFAPLLFDFVSIYKNKTYNVGHWNFYEYALTYKENLFFIENEKLTFFHFSYLKIDEKDHDKDLLCNISFDDKPVLQKIAYDYWDHLKKNNYREIKNIPYTYKDLYVSPPLSFIDPVLAKSEELDSTKIQLNSVETELNLTKKQLDSTDIELNLTKKKLDSTDIELNLTKKQLDSTDIELNLTKKKLDSTDIELNLTKKKLDSTDIELNLNKIELGSTKSQLDSRINELNAIYSSRERKIIVLLWKISSVVIPKESFRRKTVKYIWKYIKVTLIFFLKIARRFRKINTTFTGVIQSSNQDELKNLSLQERKIFNDLKVAIENHNKNK